MPDRQFNIFPVIKAGSFHLTTFKRKTQGLDEMQDGAHGQAGTTDISGIPMDFRRNQNDVPLYVVVIVMKWVFTQFG